MRGVNGLHHVTAIAGPAQENLDFYAGILGMRLVKRSVNQDDPGTYHLFYADAEGHAGSDLTFFPWAHLSPSRPGHGLAMEVALEVPPGSLDYWGARFDRYSVPIGSTVKRFGQSVLPVTDPHGLRVALVEADSPRIFTPWEASPVPVNHQIRGLFGAQVWEKDVTATTAFLTNVLGFEQLGQDRDWTRYGCKNSAGVIDVREVPGAGRGAWGVGSVHHLAWRVDDETHQLEIRTRIKNAGHQATPVIDRFWFKSVYFNEPGNVLFELATDGPGFGIDEDAAHLGESLVLPPWLEAQRPEIERGLPRLDFNKSPHTDRES